LIAATAGNGMVLPVLALTLALALLLPLGVSMAAADALAGESAHGTLRGLLLAPVSRDRVVGVKGFGVLAVAVAAVGTITITGVLTGLVVVGTSAAGGQLLTLSGSTVGLWEAAGRVGLAAAYVIVQLAAVGAVALAVSSLTDHPLVVMAAVLAGAIVFGVLTAIPALDWLQPWLLTTHWPAIADVLRDPLPLDGLARGGLLAVAYLVAGLVLTVVRTRTREA
jgi:ABC-2 type transport system permease protein